MKIKEVMNKAVVIDRDISLREAAKIMADKNIGSLIVMNKEDIQGIITDTDIIRNISKLDSKVSKTMSKNVIVIEDSETLDQAAAMMSENKIKRLPVVRNDKLVGIITATNVIANANELNENFFFE